MRYFLIPALLGLAGLLAVTDTAQAQVRIRIGVGGGPGYYSRGYYPYPYTYPYPYGYNAPRSIYYPPPVVVVPRETYYVPRVVTVEPPRYVAPTVASNVAGIRVLVPDANAKVWFDGTLTNQKGTDRLFNTPELAPGGTYSYRIRASWQDGQQVQEQVVQVTPGQTVVVDFSRPVSEP